MTVKQAYVIASALVKDMHLKSILNFGDDFGFLFIKAKNEMTFGTSYILVNKNNGDVTLLPTTPNNIDKIQSATKLPLTLVR